MKNYLRLLALFVTAGVILLVFVLFRQAAAPESALIARERQNMSRGLDKSRAERDPVYAYQFRGKLQFLSYRLAVAYNNEKKPDDAIAVLKQLIADEETSSTGGISRRSRSYRNEADWYEALQASYHLKGDRAAAQTASEHRDRLLVKAESAEQREEAGEGKFVGTPGE